MSDGSSILVLSACTATKTPDGGRPILAEHLYAGQQHRRLMRGVTLYRDAGEPAGFLNLQILSARHGVIPGSQRVRSYNATFSGLTRDRLHEHAAELRVPQAVADLLQVHRRLAVLLLGDHYLRAAQLQATAQLGAPTLVLTSPRGATRLPRIDGLHPVALRNGDARRFSCGLVGLKGALAARLLARLVDEPTYDPPLERGALLDWLEEPTGAVPTLVEDLPDAA